jgi:cytoskeletal protein RodZ
MKSLKSVNLKPSFSLSPITRWILTILILGIGVVLVVVFYAQQQTQNSKLKDQVDQAGTTLVQNSLNKRDLENRLVAANLTLAELTASFPSSEQSMDMEDALYRAAADAGVEVTSISAPEPKAETVGSSSYQAFDVTVSVTGETGSLLRFAGVVGYWLPSASIESASMSSGSMSLVLEVYTWAG